MKLTAVVSFIQVSIIFSFSKVKALAWACYLLPGNVGILGLVLPAGARTMSPPFTPLRADRGPVWEQNPNTKTFWPQTLLLSPAITMTCHCWGGQNNQQFLNSCSKGLPQRTHVCADLSAHTHSFLSETPSTKAARLLWTWSIWLSPPAFSSRYSPVARRNHAGANICPAF